MYIRVKYQSVLTFRSDSGSIVYMNKKMISIRLDTRHLELLDRASKIPGSKFVGLNRTAIIEKCLDDGLDWIKLDAENNNDSISSS